MTGAGSGPRRVVLLAPRYPHPADRGDKRRVIHLAAGLARHVDVTLLAFSSGPPAPFPADGVRVVTVRRGLAPALVANARSPERVQLGAPGAGAPRAVRLTPTVRP